MLFVPGAERPRSEVLRQAAATAHAFPRMLPISGSLGDERADADTMTQIDSLFIC